MIIYVSEKTWWDLYTPCEDNEIILPSLSLHVINCINAFTLHLIGTLYVLLDFQK